MKISRLSWLSLGLVLLAALIWLCTVHGSAATLVTIGMAIAPDLTLIGAFAAKSTLKPNRVLAYNIAHALPPAVTTVGAGALVLWVSENPLIMIAGLAWVTHIAIDRACGYGLRASDGSQRAEHQAPRTVEA